MQCRSHCGACCTAPSISSPIPGMPNGKAAGQACIHLVEEYRCAIFNDASRPKVCSDFMAEAMICGNSREEAMIIIASIEAATTPTDNDSIARSSTQ
ncbi:MULTISPECIES: YkgJ family cysteine cluster protein [Marinomonas]|uniref:YkgJ family cysteine cluster protein n=1 Tax=Marinomonas TaxID=28253 RepID=UPI0010546232|nr:YkgJ family cysteine cluster protein [Marinomonas flavescens]